MVSQRELNAVIEQVNSSYNRLLKQLAKLELEVEDLKALNTSKAKSKQKDWLFRLIVL